jgi:ribosome-associated protein YbcJ (S4-like RNA binding protein)
MENSATIIVETRKEKKLVGSARVTLKTEGSP